MAKRQRPSLLANLDVNEGQGGEPQSDNVVNIEPKPTPKSKSAITKTSLYLPPKAHHKLKEIALAKNCKVHDLVIDGINKVLAENGFSSVAEIAES